MIGAGEKILKKNEAKPSKATTKLTLKEPPIFLKTFLGDGYLNLMNW